MKAFVHPNQRKEIEREIKDLEGMLTGAGGMEHTTSLISNPAEIKQEIAQKRKTLQEGTPKKFRNDKEANKARAWAKKAEKWIADNAPKHSDASLLFPNSKSKHGADHDFERSVDQQIAWQKNKKAQAILNQYKNIMQRLDPEDPMVRNTERLRRR